MIAARFTFALMLGLAALPAVAAPDQPAPNHAPKAAAQPSKQEKHKAAKPAKVAGDKAPNAKAKPAVQPPAAAPVVAPKPEEAKPAPEKTESAKPVETKAAPHFASLRSEKVNMRSGPSGDFPIQWVFMRRGLPVEIVASFDIWRKVRDFDGTEGWVHQQMLTGRRNVMVTGAVRDLRRDPDPASGIVAQLEPGVIASVAHCDMAWCELKAGGYKGWLKREELWGLEPDEVIQ